MELQLACLQRREAVVRDPVIHLEVEDLLRSVLASHEDAARDAPNLAIEGGYVPEALFSEETANLGGVLSAQVDDEPVTRASTHREECASDLLRYHDSP
ncbi:MAG: hypothetical protein EVA89_28760 [Sandaracinaceae bacterium]|nr:MAG: hypothetical protein EVA89_28760 [Sandaracinaceae bacterium]